MPSVSPPLMGTVDPLLSGVDGNGGSCIAGADGNGARESQRLIVMAELTSQGLMGMVDPA